MAVLNVLVSSGLIFMHTSDIFVRNISKLYDSIIPEHYNIKLVPYVNQNIFYGECNISINILRDMNYINFHSDIKCISSIILTDNPEFQKYDKKKIIVHKPSISFYNKETHIFQFGFDNKLPSGRYILQIKFIGVIANDKGFRIMPLKKNRYETWIAATHFQKIGAQKMFPCWNEPTLRATFNISIKHHDSYMVFSNMPRDKVRESKLIRNSKVWTHFLTTPTMSTHLVAAVAINRSEFINFDGGANATIWCRRKTISHLLHSQSVIKNITLYLESKWKRSQLKVDHVVIPKFQDVNMVNLGIVLYRESNILYHNKLDPIARKFEIAYLIGRKVVQEWFYNAFNSSWCSSEWLSEALIPFVGLHAAYKALPNFRMIDLFVVQFLQDYLHLEADPSMWPVTSRTNSSFEVPRCIKALIYLRMLERSCIEIDFWNTFHQYIHNNGPSYDVFVKAILANEKNIHQRTKLLTMIDTMNSWAKQKHYPIINIMRDYTCEMLRINISIQNFNTSSNYYMPITYTIQTLCDFKLVSMDFLLKGPYQEHTFKFIENGWIILNKQQIGYYRVKYDFENWRKILNYLDSENYIKIHVLNRAQIIDDAFHLTIARQIDSSIFWNLTNYLSRETDYVAWYPMFKALEYMSSVFPLREEKVDFIKKRMREILNNLLIKINYEEIDDKDEFRIFLRQEAAKWACILDDLTCKIKAYYKLKQHLTNHTETQKLLPWWKEWTFCKGLMIASATDFVWQTVYHMGMEKFETKFLEFLACSEDTGIIIGSFNIYFKSERIIANPKYHINSYLFTIAKHVKNYEVLKNILSNFHKIKPKQVSVIVAIIVIVNNVYDKDQLNKDIAKFVNEEENKAKQAAHLTIYNEKNLSEKEKINKQLNDAEQLAIKMESKIKIRCDQIDNNINYLQSLVRIV